MSFISLSLNLKNAQILVTFDINFLYRLFIYQLNTFTFTQLPPFQHYYYYYNYLFLIFIEACFSFVIAIFLQNLAKFSLNQKMVQ